MPKYKPMLIRFDSDSYNHELKKCNEKIAIIKEAIAWAENHIVIFDKEEFAQSFTAFFRKEYYESNKDKIHLDIQIDRLLDLVGIDLTRLQVLESKFNSIDSELDYTDGIEPKIDRKQFEVYTKSSEENEILRDGRNFLDALERIERHVKIYPANIISGTSSLIGYDIRKGEFHINVQR